MIMVIYPSQILNSHSGTLTSTFMLPILLVTNTISIESAVEVKCTAYYQSIQHITFDGHHSQHNE